MSAFIPSHNRAFRAEWLKLKRSGLFWLCLGASAFVPVITTLVNIFIDVERNSTDGWNDFIHNNFSGFTGFFYPLFLVIMMVRIVYLEHRSDTWKLMETQPVSRLALFLSKYEVASIIAFLSLLGMLLFSLGGGMIVQLVKPKSPLRLAHIDWSLTFSVLIRFWMASLGLLAIQYFLSLLIKSFAWPMTIGLIAMIGGSILIGLGIMAWFPYAATSLTSQSYKGSGLGTIIVYHEWLSMLWAVLFLWVSYRFFIKRDLVRALFTPIRQVFYTIAVVVVFGLLFWWINKPVVMGRYSATVFAGKIKTDLPVDKIIVVRAPAFDTVMTGVVKDGAFHLSTTEHLLPGTYYVKAGKYRTAVFFGSSDSIYLTWNDTKENTDIRFGGTRQAENVFLQNNPGNFYMLTEYGYTFKPADYASAVMDQWRSGVKEMEKFKTVDNVKPAPDFIALQKKLLAVRLLTLLDVEYPKTFAVYYPNDSLKYPNYISKLRKEVSLNDSSLVAYEEFNTYVSEYLRFKAGTGANRDSLYFRSIQDSLRNSTVRDIVLFNDLKSKLTYAGDSARRNALLQVALPSVQNAVLRQQLSEQAHRLNMLMRGLKAPGFIAEAINGQEIGLGNLARRYIVVDVWASWCGPCKREAPYFESLAERYTSEGVAFVSISVDEDKNAWKRAVLSKSKRVLQLWARNAGEDFQKQYAIASIPRFMLIDAKGNIVNAQMPAPSDPEFETILHKEIAYLQ